MGVTAVDYSWTKPSVAALKGAGITDVFRYVGPPSWGKTITQAEHDALVAAGIRVYLVFEESANDSDGGFNAGVANAHTALQYLPQGYPTNYPIFFAADKNLMGSSLASAVQYIRGASTAIGPQRTGDYGPGALCQATNDAGYAQFHWQSDSTSFNGNAHTLPITQVQQGLDGPLPGTDADVIIHPLIATPVQPTPTGGRTMTCDVPTGGILICRPDGGVFAYQGAQFYGSLPGLGVKPGAPVVGICSTSTGKGYWLVDSGGGVYCFGDAQMYGPGQGWPEEWGIVGDVEGIVRGSEAGVAYELVADTGAATPALYGITTDGKYAKAA